MSGLFSLQSIPCHFNTRFKLIFFFKVKPGSQGHYCVAFQGSDTCLNPVEMRSRAKGTDPGNNDGVTLTGII